MAGRCNCPLCTALLERQSPANHRPSRATLDPLADELFTRLAAGERLTDVVTDLGTSL